MNSCEWRGCDIGEVYSGSCFGVDDSLLAAAAAAISLYAVLISVSNDIKLSSSESASYC